MKKKQNIMIMVFAVIIFTAGIIGITYALTKYSSTTTNKVTTGTLATKIVEEYTADDNVLPGKEVSKLVSVKNTGGIDELVRVKITKLWGSSRLGDGTLVQTEDDKALGTSNIVINYNSDKWLDGNDGYYYYKGILSPNSTTEKLLDKFTISKDTGNEYKNKLADLIVTAEAIQTKGDAISNAWNKTYEDLGIEAPATTSDTTPTVVTYVNPTQKFTFSGTNGDLFANFKNLEPGESITQNIKLTNSYDNPQSFYLKAENATQDEDTKTKVDQLIKQYLSVTIKNGSETIYSGPIWGNLDSESDSMKNDISLGTFNKNTIKNLTVTLNAASTMPNDLQGLTGNINWTFTTYETDATLTVHHYIYGTTNKVPNKTSGVVNDEVTEKQIGDEYTTSASTDISNNYQYKEVLATGDPATGTIEKATTEVTYYYELKTATVTTHYYIQGTTTSVPSTTDGETVADVTQNKKYTDAYTTSAATNVNANYELVETPANATGTVSQDNVVVTYYYKLKSATVTTHYYIQGTTTSVPSTTTGVAVADVTENKKYGEAYTTSAATNVSANYELVETPANATGTVSQDSIVVTYYYKTKSATLTTHYYIQGTTTSVPSTTTGVAVADVTENKKYGETYTTNAATNVSANYELVETPTNATGTISQDSVVVTYYYKLKKVVFEEEPEFSKTAKTEITSKGEAITYGISYTAKVSSYAGTILLTITDTLPYEIDTTTSTLDGGVYNEAAKTITWTSKIENVNATASSPQNIIFSKNISLVYKNINYANDNITNNIKATLSFPSTGEEFEKSSSSSTNINVDGNVVVKYLVENSTVKIIPDITLKGNIGTAYTTEAKTFRGWKLVTTPTNATGNYGADDITVIYYYEKEIIPPVNEISKIGPEEINSFDEPLDYKISYTTNLENYTGKAYLTIVEKIPFELDLTKSEIAGGTYDKNAKTITWTYEEQINEVNAGDPSPSLSYNYNLKLQFINVDYTKPFTNEVKYTLKTDKETSGSSSSTTTPKIDATVITHHYLIGTEKKLANDETTKGLIGDSYQTSQSKSLLAAGYKVTKISGETSGVMSSTETTVIYYYEKVDTNPYTGDDIAKYIVLMTVSAVVLVSSTYFAIDQKRKNALAK